MKDVRVEVECSTKNCNNKGIATKKDDEVYWPEGWLKAETTDAEFFRIYCIECVKREKMVF